MFHVLNRGVGRRTLFDKGEDFLAFERVIEETLRTCPMRICAFCRLSNHWHRVLWPKEDIAAAKAATKISWPPGRCGVCPTG